jgi:hypothetical protein
MAKTVWKAFVDYEKEEEWLNEMSAKGLAFTDYSFFRYKFTDGKPGEYIYRIELLKNLPGHPESKKYLSFMAESSVEHISSWTRWVYLRKKTENGRFDIFSDAQSKLEHYRRINMLWIPIMFMWIILAAVQFINGIDHLLERDDDAMMVFSLIYCVVMAFFTIFFFIHWRKLRKKMKRLEQEKRLRE